MSEPDIKPEEVLERYKQLPKKLESAVAGLAEPGLDLARAPDAWSIRQIVHHIVDADDATKAIVKAALGTNGCLYSLEWYDPHNTWAVTLDYRRRPTSPALSLLCANHRELEELLRHLPDAWDRHVMLRRHANDEAVRISVARLLWDQTGHAFHHIGQIEQTRRLHQV
jgi:hypothetical protein